MLSIFCLIKLYREKIRYIFTVSGMVIIPALVISLITVQDYYRIRNCDAIVIILSRRETEDIWDFLDNESFGYAIMGDIVKRFDLIYDYDPSLGNYLNNEVLESYYWKRK